MAKSVWVNSKKKRGYAKSHGSYYFKGRDRQFNLTPVNGGRAREYSSHEAAKHDGWTKAE